MDAAPTAEATLAALRISGWVPTRPRYSAFAGLSVVVLVHVGVLAALLQFDATRSALNAAVPIVVRLVAPEQPTRHVETPPKPLPITTAS